MTYMKCPYCDWEGQEPSPAEFQTMEEFLDAQADFYLGHAEQCPGAYPVPRRVQT